MYSEKQKRKRANIFAAAYSVLAEKGYKGASMLEIAKLAKASNETMYRWFGNKPGLLGAMIEDNTDTTNKVLANISADELNAMEALKQLGISALELLSDEKSIILNRAASADVPNGGRLGKLLADKSRAKLIPVLTKAIERAQKDNYIRAHDSSEIAEIYISLLIGDLQVRRMNGVINAPLKPQIENHSERVNELIIGLFGTARNNS